MRKSEKINKGLIKTDDIRLMLTVGKELTVTHPDFLDPPLLPKDKSALQDDDSKRVGESSSSQLGLSSNPVSKADGSPSKCSEQQKQLEQSRAFEEVNMGKAKALSTKPTSSIREVSEFFDLNRISLWGIMVNIVCCQGRELTDGSTFHCCKLILDIGLDSSHWELSRIEREARACTSQEGAEALASKIGVSKIRAIAHLQKHFDQLIQTQADRFFLLRFYQNRLLMTYALKFTRDHPKRKAYACTLCKPGPKDILYHQKHEFLPRHFLPKHLHPMDYYCPWPGCKNLVNGGQNKLMRHCQSKHPELQEELKGTEWSQYYVEYQMLNILNEVPKLADQTYSPVVKIWTEEPMTSPTHSIQKFVSNDPVLPPEEDGELLDLRPRGALKMDLPCNNLGTKRETRSRRKKFIREESEYSEDEDKDFEPVSPERTRNSRFQQSGIERQTPRQAALQAAQKVKAQEEQRAREEAAAAAQAKKDEEPILQERKIIRLESPSQILEALGSPLEPKISQESREPLSKKKKRKTNVRRRGARGGRKSQFPTKSNSRRAKGRHGKSQAKSTTSGQSEEMLKFDPLSSVDEELKTTSVAVKSVSHQNSSDEQPKSKPSKGARGEVPGDVALEEAPEAKDDAIPTLPFPGLENSKTLLGIEDILSGKINPEELNQDYNSLFSPEIKTSLQFNDGANRNRASRGSLTDEARPQKQTSRQDYRGGSAGQTNSLSAAGQSQASSDEGAPSEANSIQKSLNLQEVIKDEGPGDCEMRHLSNEEPDEAGRASQANSRVDKPAASHGSAESAGSENQSSNVSTMANFVQSWGFRDIVKSEDLGESSSAASPQLVQGRQQEDAQEQQPSCVQEEGEEVTPRTASDLPIKREFVGHKRPREAIDNPEESMLVSSPQKKMKVETLPNHSHSTEQENLLKTASHHENLQKKELAAGRILDSKAAASAKPALRSNELRASLRNDKLLLEENSDAPEGISMAGLSRVSTKDDPSKAESHSESQKPSICKSRITLAQMKKQAQIKRQSPDRHREEARKMIICQMLHESRTRVCGEFFTRKTDLVQHWIDSHLPVDDEHGEDSDFYKTQSQF